MVVIGSDELSVSMVSSTPTLLLEPHNSSRRSGPPNRILPSGSRNALRAIPRYWEVPTRVIVKRDWLLRALVERQGNKPVPESCWDLRERKAPTLCSGMALDSASFRTLTS